MCTLPYIKYVTRKEGLLYSTKASTQYSVMAYMRKESRKRVHVYFSVYKTSTML